MALDTSTPVLLLGGKENALAVARHLGRNGIPVYASGGAGNWAIRSRFCRKAYVIPAERDLEDYWAELLLEAPRPELAGVILFACCDEAIEFLAEHRDALALRYILEDADPALQLAMLDKQRTLELAQSVNVPAPRFWPVRSIGDVERMRAEVTFPVMVKPIHSHRFRKAFGRKLFIVEEGFGELAAKVGLALKHGIEVMVVEMIPGPDDLLSSYYTYIDGTGSNLFHVTKRILRRYPVNRGGACYHITEWLPETAELGQRFFSRINFRGMANIEFKRDLRDGRLKLIEVNARFTAGHQLLLGAGAPIDLIVYCHLTGQPAPQFTSYEQFRRYWYPALDFLAFWELRQRGELSFMGWLRSIAHRRMEFPIHDFGDPLPGLTYLAFGLGRLARMIRAQFGVHGRAAAPERGETGIAAIAPNQQGRVP